MPNWRERGKPVFRSKRAAPSPAARRPPNAWILAATLPFLVGQLHSREHGEDHVDQRSPTRSPVWRRSWRDFAARCCRTGGRRSQRFEWEGSSHGPFNLRVLVCCRSGSPCEGQPLPNGERGVAGECTNTYMGGEGGLSLEKGWIVCRTMRARNPPESFYGPRR